MRKYGDGDWEIATINVSAFKLRPIMYWMSRHGYGVRFSGLGHKNEFELPNKGYYTGKDYWPLMRDYIKAITPLKCN